MKTEFSFVSTLFNRTEPKEYFINEICFGDDAAWWLIEKLREQEIPTATRPEQEDFGWYFTFIVDGVEHALVIAFQPSDIPKGDRWVGSIERHVGFFRSVLGGRRRGILPEAITAVDKALKTSPEIQELTWLD